MKKVGIFDSGIGGLILAKEAINLGINGDIYYVSDDLFNPYGELDEAQILERSIVRHGFVPEQLRRRVLVGRAPICCALP